MNDLISRQSAIDMLATMQGRCTSKTALIQNSKIWQQIKDMPSAQPEPRWIPCSEAVPATEDKVLCQTITKKGVVNFVIGYHTETFGWACGMNSNVVAWMPLPDPYREEGEANE